MEILVKSAKAETYSNLGRYFYADMQSGKHCVFVCVKPRGIQVIVQNDAHRVWRGMGKEFPSVEAACANYKTGAIKAMIQHANQLSVAS